MAEATESRSGIEDAIRAFVRKGAPEGIGSVYLFGSASEHLALLVR